MVMVNALGEELHCRQVPLTRYVYFRLQLKHYLVTENTTELINFTVRELTDLIFLYN